MTLVNLIYPLPTFYAWELPAMASHCQQENCGMSIYRGILVIWDEDHDTRVLQFINELPLHVREKLIAVQEHEASLSLIWNRPVPEGYTEGISVDVDNDVWNISSSFECSDTQEAREQDFHNNLELERARKDWNRVCAQLNREQKI